MSSNVFFLYRLLLIINKNIKSSTMFTLFIFCISTYTVRLLITTEKHITCQKK